MAHFHIMTVGILDKDTVKVTLVTE